MYNIIVLNKNYKQIGILSNQGANPQAPYFNDLYVQELETGADTYQFSTISSKYTQDLLEIGNHIMFAYRGRQELFTITSLEYSHNEGYKTIGVYAEGLSFELLEVFMERPKDKNGNSSGGGNDSDNDGDDNTDDEYADPDDVYIDANGNIIYDKNGGTDYADPNDVTIDGNGNIIYKRSKNNKKNDSLEFKNISYPTFLNILLKGTGWTYVAQPGLESVKHDISVKYDRNIYAILQDSMQSYRGVELEFVYEFVGSTIGGKVNKVIKAYKDGGRGSFIGKRFEYGTNVRGITKMQEVANSEDDTVLRIDNVGIDITYDVDFALKSAEVPEIEIGDTHYVIDKDFHPPMTITARIGKIEVSFSDPTRNKIYLANNKRISGSAIEDELDEDSIKDIIDDHDDNNNDDPGDGGIAYDHYHTCLKDYNENSYVFLRHESLPDTYTCPFSGYKFTEKMCLEPEPYGNTLSVMGGGEYLPWDLIYGNSVNCKRLTATDAMSIISNNIKNSIYVDSLGVRSTRYMVKMINDRIENSTTMSTKDLYDFIKNLTICKYTNKEESALLDDGSGYTFGIANADKYTNSGNSVAGGIFRQLWDNPNNNPVRVGSGFIENSLLCALIGAFQYYATGNDPGSGSDGGGSDNISGGFIEASRIDVEGEVNVYGKLYVTEKIKCELTTETNTLKVNTIEFSDGTTMTTSNGSGGGSTPSNPGSGSNGSNGGCDACLCLDYGASKEYRFAGDLVPPSYITGEARPDVDTFIRLTNDSDRNYHNMRFALRENWSSDFDCLGITFKTPDEGFGSGIDSYAVFGPDSVSRPIDLGSPNYNECGRWNTIYSINSLNTSDIKYKENVIYLDELLGAQTYSYNNEAETPFLDFIKNDFRPALYNYKSQDGSDIRQEDNQLGFIANDIIDTEIGGTFLYDFGTDGEQDIMVSSNGYTTVVARALQEEIRTRDEKIASLEDRLARLEALLDIDNK